MRVGDLGRSVVVWLGVLLGGLSLYGPGYVEWVALGCIIFAGIPHGAFDLELARRVWGKRGYGVPTLIGAYLVIGFAMAAACLLVPPVGLVLFLTISVAHFSEGEGRAVGRGAGFAVALAAVFLPVALHQTAAGAYLDFFLRSELLRAGGAVLDGLALALSAGVGCVVLSLLRQRKTVDGIELLVSLVGWWVLPPLAGFAVWFIGRHGRHHVARCRELFAARTRLFTPDAILISALAIVLLLPLGFVFDLGKLDQLFAASIILIAGLTLPHMVVTHRLEHTTRGAI